jgi:hypothetical protein
MQRSIQEVVWPHGRMANLCMQYLAIFRHPLDVFAVSGRCFFGCCFTPAGPWWKVTMAGVAGFTIILSFTCVGKSSSLLEPQRCVIVDSP